MHKIKKANVNTAVNKIIEKDTEHPDNYMKVR